MIDNESLPATDDVQDQGPSEQELLDAVMANSPFAEEAGLVPLPDEGEIDEDPVESDEEDPESEEVVSEDDEEVDRRRRRSRQVRMPVKNPLPKKLKLTLWMILKISR